jgi:2-iminobutanoate/2-iminopropanoate deaminase
MFNKMSNIPTINMVMKGQNIRNLTGGNLDDMVQVNLYLKNIADFRKAADVFSEYFKNGAPARMTTTEFVGDGCLCQMDGIAYKPNT